MGSALFQPVSALTVLPGGTLATLETTYAAPGAPARALSLWHWTGFGFRLDRRAPRWPARCTPTRWAAPPSADPA